MRKQDNILASRLQETFRKYPANTALCFSTKEYTYKELFYKAISISQRILEQLNSGAAVAILGNKTFMTYAGVCGSLFASKAYMPLNLKFPLSRNRKMLELSGAKVIIADENANEMLRKILSETDSSYTIIFEGNEAEWKARFPQHHFVNPGSAIEEPPPITSKEDDTAYLLFTSGTTGIPKGVPVSNLNVLSYADHMMKSRHFHQDDRFSHTFDLTFDLSVHDMMLCWLSGACLCIPEDDTPFRMASYIRDRKISIWFSVPSAAVLMDKMRLLKKETLSTIRLSFFCGEPLPASLADKWQSATKDKPLINLYGPTEATIAISDYEWAAESKKEKNGIVSIGKVFNGQKYCLLNEDSGICFSGKGELCLGGSQVIREYLNDPALSKKYFFRVDEMPETTWYRTGDVAETDEAGDLFYLGRLDSEVKISGYRVNLLEVDAVIKNVTGSEQIASVLDDKGTPRIVSFIAGSSGISEAGIIEHCKNKLPWYMIPEVIIFVNEMPLNINGKIDRNSLKELING